MRCLSLAGIGPRVFALLFVLLGAPRLVPAACHVVFSGVAGGSHSGADWTNAYTDLPASLIRGDIYYVGAGTYGRHVFNDATSGSTIIEVRAATASDHCTDTGWNGSTMLGKAVFQATVSNSANILEFDSNYFTINGNGRSTATGNPYTDWQNSNGYNISISNANGNVCSGSSGDNQNTHVGGSGSFITLDYVEIPGNSPTTDQCAAIGVEPSASGSTHDWTISHSYLHDVGARMFEFDGKTSGGSSVGNYNMVTEWNYLKNNYSSSTDHGECYQVGSNLGSLTIAWSYITNCIGTGFIATASGGSYSAGNNANGPWSIIGNVFTSDGGPTHCWFGNGTIAFFDISFTAPVYILNNTWGNINGTTCNDSGTDMGIDFSSSHNEVFTNVYIENNVWYNSSDMPVHLSCTGTVSCTSITWDYNSWIAMADGTTSSGNDSSVHKQVTSTSPFANGLSYDFRLSADTAAGFNSNSLLSVNGTDPLGATRGTNGTWDRGAFQRTSGTVQLPNPPQNLQVISVH